MIEANLIRSSDYLGYTADRRDTCDGREVFLCSLRSTEYRLRFPVLLFYSSTGFRVNDGRGGVSFVEAQHFRCTQGVSLEILERSWMGCAWHDVTL